ncbi:MAG: hypothetical protein ACRCZF_24230, partial [Gemmataceae bacterium]
MMFSTLLLLPLAVVNPPKVMVMAPTPAASCPSDGCLAPPPPRYSTFMPGQAPPPVLAPQSCPPMGPPAPVLMTKIIGPTGSRITLVPGTGNARMFGDNVTVGYRPGYIYRAELSGLPNTSEVLYPEFEVRGSLVPRNGMNYTDHPTPVVFSSSDIQKAVNGALVVKVIFLEDPQAALPIATSANQPLEETMDTMEQAVKSARDFGRLVMIVRLGNRKPDPQTLEQASVPGTILFPGETHLPAPTSPPVVGWQGVPLFDPILGPKPTNEECLTDGGDRDTRLGISPDEKVRGLDTSDVSADYMQGNKKKVTTSNRVCICVPRFRAYRVEAAPGGLGYSLRASAGTSAVTTAGYTTNVPPMALAARYKPVGYESRLRAMVQVARQGLHALTGPPFRPAAVAVANGVSVVAKAIGPDELTNLPNDLIVTKSVEPSEGVKIGDVVTFTIKYMNRTAQPIT